MVILDNFVSHKSDKTRKAAEELGIDLVFLPSYSPHLNPIEQLWKDLKRSISPVFVKDKKKFLKLIKNSFKSLSQNSRYAKNWIKTFLALLKPFPKNKLGYSNKY